MKVVIDHEKHIYGLTDEQIKKIKEELTFDNPVYAQTMKYSKWGKTNVPKKLYYYSGDKECFNVPLGYSLEQFSNVTYVDDRIDVGSPFFPPFKLKLRVDQKKAKDAFINQDMNNSKGVVQLSTAKGKTVIALAIASELKTKTLIVVHKNDLVVGWQKEIDKCFGGKIESGLIKAQSRTIGDQFTIATVQTLYRMSEEELDVLFNTFTMVVHDELHHVPSTCFSISSRFNAKYKLGLSATPERNDGLTHIIHLYYGDTCYRNEYTHFDKDILPVKVIIKNIGIHFEPVCIPIFKNGEIKKVELKKGDYFNIKEKGDIYYRDIPRHLSKPDLHYSYVDSSVVLNEDYGNVVLNDILYEYKKGRSIVIFITQKNHCEIYYNNLASIIGEENVQLFYGDSFESDETLLNRAEERKVKITITTLSKGTEGTNVKAWEVAFLVSSINNGKGVEQAIGRIRRVKEGKINPCIVYDYRFPHVYMLANHGKTRDNRYQKMKCFIEKR